MSSAPAWPEGAYAIDPEPFVRIGREEAGPYQLALVAAGALLQDGRIVVADAGAQEVRLFDSPGQHVRTLGGAGDGPGEFRGLSSVFDYPGDSIAAFDGYLYRTTVDCDGFVSHDPESGRGQLRRVRPRRGWAVPAL